MAIKKIPIVRSLLTPASPIFLYELNFEFSCGNNSSGSSLSGSLMYSLRLGVDAGDPCGDPIRRGSTIFIMR